jgi:hypothetical protein
MRKGIRKQGICEVCGISFYKYRKCLKYCSWACSAKTKESIIDEKYKEKTRQRIKDKSEIDKITGCWNWIKYKDFSGRAYCTYGKQTLPAAKISYLVFIGDIPNGIFVCHKCDNYSCVNPNHLFLGTHQDNMTDRDKKNRVAKGEKIFISKLKNENILEIREMRKNGFSQQKIADQFSISQTTVSRILDGSNWKHI